MFLLVHGLVFLLSKTANAQAHTASSPCCPQKTVGNLTYQLTGRENRDFTHKHGCLNDCVYKTAESSQLICFKQGSPLPEVPLPLSTTGCNTSTTPTPPSFSSPPEPCCPEKTIGKLTYRLTGREDSSLPQQHGCLNNCIYSKEDSDKMICFTRGKTLPEVPLLLTTTGCNIPTTLDNYPPTTIPFQKIY